MHSFPFLMAEWCINGVFSVLFFPWLKVHTCYFEIGNWPRACCCWSAIDIHFFGADGTWRVGGSREKDFSSYFIFNCFRGNSSSFVNLVLFAAQVWNGLIKSPWSVRPTQCQKLKPFGFVIISSSSLCVFFFLPLLFISHVMINARENSIQPL